MVGFGGGACSAGVTGSDGVALEESVDLADVLGVSFEESVAEPIIESTTIALMVPITHFARRDECGGG
jgi:hypothetical protein